MGINPLLKPNEMKKPDKLTLLSYLSIFYELFLDADPAVSPTKSDDLEVSLTSMSTPGSVEGGQDMTGSLSEERKKKKKKVLFRRNSSKKLLGVSPSSAERFVFFLLLLLFLLFAMFSGDRHTVMNFSLSFSDILLVTVDNFSFIKKKRLQTSIPSIFSPSRNPSFFFPPFFFLLCL